MKRFSIIISFLIRKLPVILLFNVILVSSVSAGEILERVEKSIASSFGNEIEIKVEKFQIPDNVKKLIEHKVKQRFFRDYVYLYRIIKNDSVIAYAILDNVIGKVMPITFMVYFDNNGKITKSEIIKYREQYGGAVVNPEWNKQFIGKDSKSDFVVGKNIDGISGATISVHSVTKGIRKLTLLFSVIILNV